MIQDYLKTGMVFYDDQDKQHFRSECCKDAFCQYTDKIHFPSFQVIGNNTPEEPIGIIWEIYDLEDNLIVSTPAAGFTSPKLSVFGLDGGGYQYSHDFRDDVSYPSEVEYGKCYYMKLRINANPDNEEFYSEAFKVCDCDIAEDECQIPGERTDEAIHSTEFPTGSGTHRGSHTHVVVNQTHSPAAYYHNGKTYNVFTGQDTNSNKQYIWAYYHDTEVESENYLLHTASEETGVGDDHHCPGVIVADDNHIVVVSEVYRNGTHNGALGIQRSDYEEDETHWTQSRNEVAGWYAEVGNTTTERLAYVSLYKLFDGTLVIITRRYSGGGRYTRIYRSTDHGKTWDGGYDITDSGDGSDWHYKIGATQPTDDVIRFAIRWLDTVTMRYEKVYYLESHDGGDTWQDVDGTHSQDITSAGAISQATLDGANNYQVVNNTDVGKEEILPRSIVVDCKETGRPFICTAEWDSDSAPYTMRIFWWSGSSWENSIIDNNIQVTNGGPADLLFKEKENLICYIADDDGGDNVLYSYETFDLKNWQTRKVVKSSSGLSSYTLAKGQFVMNYQEADYWMFFSLWGNDGTSSADIWYETGRSEVDDIDYTFCEFPTLVWWSDCDWDDIIYQGDYRNSLVIPECLNPPSEDIEKKENERSGEKFPSEIVVKKRYKIKFRIPEYLWNALIRLPAYGSNMPNFHCWLTMPDGSSCPMSEVNVSGEWDTGNCFNNFEIEFVDDDEYPVVGNNCCDNEDVSII